MKKIIETVKNVLGIVKEEECGRPYPVVYPSPGATCRAIHITKKDGTTIVSRPYLVNTDKFTVKEMFEAKEIKVSVDIHRVPEFLRERMAAKKDVSIDLSSINDIDYLHHNFLLPTGPWMQDFLRAMRQENVTVTTEVYDYIADCASKEGRKPENAYEDYFELNYAQA